MRQKKGACFRTLDGPLGQYSPLVFSSSGAKEKEERNAASDEGVPSLPPVALGLRAADDSAGFLGTFGTLKAAWAGEARYPSTLSSSSKLRSAGKEAGQRVNDLSIITAGRMEVIRGTRVNGVKQLEVTAAPIPIFTFQTPIFQP